MARNDIHDDDAPDFTAGLGETAAASAAVVDPPEPAFHDLTAEVEMESGRPDQWDGKPSALTIAVPGLVRDHQQIRVGSVVMFQASRGPDGVWRGPESEHVVDLWRLGFFAGTKAHSARMRKQTVRDEELGIYDDPELVDPDDPSKGVKGGAKGLAPKTDDEISVTLRQMFGGGPKDMVRRERQEARAEDTHDPRQWPGSQSQKRTA